jgi:hypothetical protein
MYLTKGSLTLCPVQKPGHLRQTQTPDPTIQFTRAMANRGPAVTTFGFKESGCGPLDGMGGLDDDPPTVRTLLTPRQCQVTVNDFARVMMDWHESCYNAMTDDWEPRRENHARWLKMLHLVEHRGLPVNLCPDKAPFEELTLLYMAAQYAHPSVVRRLLELGGNPRWECGGQGCMQAAAHHTPVRETLEICAMLPQEGVAWVQSNPSFCRSFYKQTMLHYIVKDGCDDYDDEHDPSLAILDLLQWVLNHPYCPPLDAKNGDGLTALEVCRDEWHTDREMRRALLAAAMVAKGLKDPDPNPGPDPDPVLDPGEVSTHVAHYMWRKYRVRMASDTPKPVRFMNGSGFGARDGTGGVAALGDGDGDSAPLTPLQCQVAVNDFSRALGEEYYGRATADTPPSHVLWEKMLHLVRSGRMPVNLATDTRRSRYSESTLLYMAVAQAPLAIIKCLLELGAECDQDTMRAAMQYAPLREVLQVCSMLPPSVLPTKSEAGDDAVLTVLSRREHHEFTEDPGSANALHMALLQWVLQHPYCPQLNERHRFVCAQTWGEDNPRTAMVVDAMRAQQEQQQRWSLLRAAWVGAAAAMPAV